VLRTIAGTQEQGRFWTVRVGSAELSNTACVGLQKGYNGHGKQLANEQITSCHYL